MTDEIIVEPQYVNFPNIPGVEPAMAELGAKWVKSENCWRLPRLQMNLQLLDEYYGPHSLQIGWWQANCIGINAPGLYDFQKIAVQRLLSAPFPGQMLALSPGLGKTVIAVTALKYLRAQTVLIICPKILINVWQDHLERWGGLDLLACSYVVINYEQVIERRTQDSINRQKALRHHWDVLIIDESTRIKNRDTKTFQAIEKIRANADRVWELSGSPITRYADDLWAQFRMIWPSAFKSYWRFANRFCYIEETVWGKVVKGSRPFDPRVFDDIMYVVQQKEVIDLPEVSVEQYSVPLNEDQQEAHRQALEDFLIQFDTGQISIPTKLAQMIRLQQVVSNTANLGGPDSSAKSDAVMEILGSLEESEFPVLIWTHWRVTAKQLAERLRQTGLVYQVLTGDNSEESSEIIQEFQDEKMDVLILSLDLGSHGITLTKARTVIYHDLTFNADQFVQSIHRVQRIGLDHPVKTFVLKSPDTVDEYVFENLQGKARSIEKITRDDIQRLLK